MTKKEGREGVESCCANLGGAKTAFEEINIHSTKYITNFMIKGREHGH